jgi:hypothetical protein
MKIFIIESPSPNDFLEECNEADSLITACNMFGHEAKSFFVKDQKELYSTINYINRIKLEEDDVLCLHFSCHGNKDGLQFGDDLTLPH